jgi:hypothetical protein
VSWAKYFGKHDEFVLEKGDKINRARSGFRLQNSGKLLSGSPGFDSPARHLFLENFCRKPSADDLLSAGRTTPAKKLNEDESCKKNCCTV